MLFYKGCFAWFVLLIVRGTLPCFLKNQLFLQLRLSQNDTLLGESNLVLELLNVGGLVSHRG